MMPAAGDVDVARSFEILHLLAELLDHAFQFKADIGQFHVVRFGAERVGFAVELLRQKIEPPPDRAAAGEKLARLRDMRREPVELLADVGLGRRAGSPPDAAGRDRSGCDASSNCATCSASFFLIASGWRPGAFSARADKRSRSRQAAATGFRRARALVPAHLGKPLAAPRKARDDRGFRGAAWLRRSPLRRSTSTTPFRPSRPSSRGLSASTRPFRLPIALTQRQSAPAR